MAYGDRAGVIIHTHSNNLHISEYICIRICANDMTQGLISPTSQPKITLFCDTMLQLQIPQLLWSVHSFIEDIKRRSDSMPSGELWERVNHVHWSSTQSAQNHQCGTRHTYRMTSRHYSCYNGDAGPAWQCQNVRDIVWNLPIPGRLDWIESIN